MKTKSRGSSKKTFMRIMSFLTMIVMLVTLSVPVYAEDSAFKNAKAWKSDRNYLKDAKVLGFYVGSGSTDEGCFAVNVLDCGINTVFDTIDMTCDEYYDRSRISFDVKIYFDQNVAISIHSIFDNSDKTWYSKPYARFSANSDFSYCPTDIKYAMLYDTENETVLNYFGISQVNDGMCSFMIPTNSRLLPVIKNALTNNIELVVYEDNKCVYYSNSMRVSPYMEEMDIDISSLKIDKISAKSYTGSAVTPDVKITDGKYTLKKDLDYTLSYKNNKEIGTASVTITGKGTYTGSKTVNFKIVFGKPSLSVTKSGTGAKLSWNTVSGATGYQVWQSVSGGKYKKIKTVSGTSLNVSLKSGKTYKFKVRAYTPKGDKIMYSDYSAVKTVKK